MFTLGLASSSFVTGSNILLLLDFFLFGVVFFNFLYLILLRKFTIEIQISASAEEDCEPTITVLTKQIYPLKADLTLHWSRFNQNLQTNFTFLYFDNYWSYRGDSFPLRGVYQLTEIDIEIEFPFPLFLLTGKFSVESTVTVFPSLVNQSKLSIDGSLNKAKAEDSFSHYVNYVPGDSVRLISWKQFAKTGNLMIKKFDTHQIDQKSFLIKFDSNNEKLVFQQALKVLKNRIDQKQAFRIISNKESFIFDGEHNNFKELLIFLARYEMPLKSIGNNSTEQFDEISI